jgi:hypothetical protein
MTPTTIRTAQQMRDGLMQGGYIEQAQVIDELIQAATGDTRRIFTDGKAFEIHTRGEIVTVHDWREALGKG